MKNQSLLMIILSILFISCSSNEEPNPETAEPFARANQLQFYYSSSTNEDLLNLNDSTIIPISYEGEYIPSNLPQQNSADPTRYFYPGGSIEYDSAIQKYYWNTIINGKKGIKENRIFVRISETDTDTLDVNFEFKKGVFIGSNSGFYAIINKLYYNKTLILEEKENTYSGVKKISILKKGNKTVISFMN